MKTIIKMLEIQLEADKAVLQAKMNDIEILKIKIKEHELAIAKLKSK
jgi:hypothetical protein